MYQAQTATVRGRLAEAEQLVDEARLLGEIAAHPDLPAYVATQLSVLRVEQGRAAEAVEVALAEVHRQPWSGVEAVLAATYAAAGRLDDAAGVVAQFRDVGFEIPRNMTWLSTMALLARTVVAVGDVADGDVLYELLAPYSGLLACAGSATFGLVDHRLGRLAELRRDVPAARRHLASAMATCERVGMRVTLARVRLDLGRLHLEHGDPDAGRRLVEQAAETGRHLNLPDVLEATARLI
jgi:hypothetical protein